MATGDIKRALGSLVSLTAAGLQSLASSATVGWQSDEVDNTSTGYDEVQIQCVLDFANTTPANSKGVYVFLASGLETGKLTNPAIGCEFGITLCDVTLYRQNMLQIGFVEYGIADEVVESSVMTVPAPPYWAVILVNHSGAALAASGNTVKYRGVYHTVAS